MHKIKMNKMKIVPTPGTVYVQEIGVEVKDQLFEPATIRTDKEYGFGLIVYASEEEKHLIGKIILVNPFRKTPAPINGERLYEICISDGYSLVHEVTEQDEKLEMQRMRDAKK